MRGWMIPLSTETILPHATFLMIDSAMTGTRSTNVPTGSDGNAWQVETYNSTNQAAQ
eukprot:COSAG06_NODE_353_length_16899_cov_14.694345_15_plen_57_part_00